MGSEYLCTLSDINVSVKGERVLENIQYNIKEGVIETFISQDNSAGTLLQVIGGFLVANEGEIAYPMYSPNKKNLSKWLQYVPDDIVCYTDMKVKEFLQGVAMAVGHEDAIETAARLCGLFEIDVEENLLDMTFEKNRLVAMVQAIMAKPRLLLLDRPYDMIGTQRYALLLKELVKLKANGTTILIATEAYDKVMIPCNQYVFLKNGNIYAQYNRKELPVLSKVVKFDNGNPAVFKRERMKVLCRTKKSWCFLYREESVAELVLKIYQSGCTGFTVNELSMEEEVYGEYERWLL